MSLTASNLVHAINNLNKKVHYNYINGSTTTKIIICEVIMPEGPIFIKRYNSSKGQGPQNAKKTSISTQMIWRVANSVSENYPINVDRVLGASYNTRSALETLMAHTPEFYFCYPGRIESISSQSKIQRGHKHLIYNPNKPHKIGLIKEIKTNIVISEIPTVEAIYDALVLPEPKTGSIMDIDVQRRHAQIQIALLLIGIQLGSRIWVAQNDRGIEYHGARLGEMEGVIQNLNDERLITSHQEAVRAALLIDLIWFRNAKFMPAVFEIEHSTGIVSGLTRMKNFKDNIPEFPTRWVIVGNDNLRDKTINHANQPQFKSLKTRFMSYTSVEELLSLCQRRKIKGVTDDFLDCFMEECVKN